MDWIFRFFPGNGTDTWTISAPGGAAARVPIVNPLSRLLRQTKGLYALWRETSLVDEADTALLNRYTPHTESFSKDRVETYLANRETWVLKKLFGRMGDTVALGRLCTPENWQSRGRGRQGTGGLDCPARLYPASRV